MGYACTARGVKGDDKIVRRSHLEELKTAGEHKEGRGGGVTRGYLIKEIYIKNRLLDVQVGQVASHWAKIAH